MPQIAKMIQRLDASSAHKELVSVYNLRNADPQDVSQLLQDLFNRNSTMRSSGSSSSSLLGQNNPLVARATKAQTTTTSSGFGNSTGSGGSGGLGAAGAGGPGASGGP
jgi:hypothetical protein